MRRRFQPHRRLRNEVFSLVLALSAPFVLCAVFPLAALQPLPPSPSAATATSCAFVTLTPEQERKALAAARTAWQLDRRTDRPMRIDLLAESLPAMPSRPIIAPSFCPQADRTASEPYAPDLLPRSLAAPPPATISPQPDADIPVPTFSREDMLQLY